MIFPNSNQVRVFLKPGYTDMRKQFNGLSQIGRYVMNQNVYSGSYFVFCNKRRNLIKILYYDTNGFCIWQKKLGKGDQFPWPKNAESDCEMNTERLQWLIKGVDFFRMHKEKKYKII